ncbi:MAG TPA: MaoC family dehydratase [Thermoanaerobaculia bacterium]
MGKTVIDGVAGVEGLAGKELGVSEWRPMTYEAILKFADATGDHQWIHVDRERTARESPFGKPIAHGYFTLSLIAGLFFEMVEVKNFAMVINYGLNKVRFPAPVPSGSRVRGSFVVGAVAEEDWGRQVTMTATIEREGGDKPVCVAEVVYRYYRL